MKKLGFLSADGTPTEYYNQLKDPQEFRVVIAERVKELYGELFELNTEIYSASDSEIKGAIGRVTGKDDATVIRYLNTFKALLQLADFDEVEKVQIVEKPEESSELTQKISNRQLLDRKW